MFLLFATLYAGPPEPAADEAEIQELVHRARVGNTSAASRLYRLHVARVFRAVRPLCGNDAEAEDITQSAFADALSNLTRYEPRAGSRFLHWLVTLALNRARKGWAWRKRWSAPGEEDAESSARSETTSLTDDDVLLRGKLLRALSELPERDRRVLALRYGAELTADEVEEATGVSAANVRKICERRRKELQVSLDSEAVDRGAAR